MQHTLPNAHGLRDTVVRAFSRSRGGHSAVYVYTSGIAAECASLIHEALDEIARGLGEVVTVAPLDTGDLVLFLEGWPLDRALMVARLVRVTLQGMEIRHSTDMNVRLGVTPVGGNLVGFTELLNRARDVCHSADQGDIIQIDSA